MSLILEALRKLDREKQVPERGFLVMAPASWPAREYPGRRWTWLAVALVVLAAGGLAWQGRAPRSQPVEAPPTPRQPAARPAASLLPPAARVESPVAAPSRAPASTSATAPAAATSAEAPAPAAVAPSPAALVLQAITERDGQPVALINDRMLREGDELEGARIVKIGDTFVEIEYQGRRTALRF